MHLHHTRITGHYFNYKCLSLSTLNICFLKLLIFLRIGKYSTYYYNSMFFFSVSAPRSEPANSLQSISRGRKIMYVKKCKCQNDIVFLKLSLKQIEQNESGRR